MLTHLRLARNRGSLHAPNSPVQDRALEILDMLDVVEAQGHRLDSVKIGLLSPLVTEDRAKSLFPEFYPADPFADALQDDGTYDPSKVDEDEIEYDAPSSPEEDDDISAWISSRESGSFTADDLR